MTPAELLESVTALLADCIYDEGFDFVLAGVPIEYDDKLTRVAKYCAQTLLKDGFLDGGGADMIEVQRQIIVELRSRVTS